MISEPDYENLRTLQHDRTAQVWSLAVSVFLNLLVWMLVSWHGFMHMVGAKDAQKPEQMIVMNSSQLEIRQPQPQYALPERHAATAQSKEQPLKKPEHAAEKQPVPKPEAQPTELAQIRPNAPPQPRSAPRQRAASLAEELAQQEVAFQQEARQLNANRSPISVATADPNARDTENTPFHAAFAGTRILQGKGDGFLVPLRHWRSEGLNCYYGRYYWTYPTGGEEIAVIPWPFCYDPADDPIAHGVREFPFPLPLSGYRLPAGTPLQPIEKDVYEDWLAHQ
jgi:hypothetical protein